MSKVKKTLRVQMFHVILKKKVMEIDVKTITPEFCQRHCPFYDADYEPSDSDFQSLYIDGDCLFTEYAIPCQLLDTELSAV